MQVKSRANVGGHPRSKPQPKPEAPRGPGTARPSPRDREGEAGGTPALRAGFTRDSWSSQKEVRSYTDLSLCCLDGNSPSDLGPQQGLAARSGTRHQGRYHGQQGKGITSQGPVLLCSKQGEQGRPRDAS